MKINAPCAKCERKGCGTYHAECKEYQSFVEHVKSEKQKAIEHTKTYAELNKVKRESVEKQRRRRGGK